jgi:hypothetical protein
LDTGLTAYQIEVRLPLAQRAFSALGSAFTVEGTAQAVGISICTDRFHVGP